MLDVSRPVIDATAKDAASLESESGGHGYLRKLLKLRNHRVVRGASASLLDQALLSLLNLLIGVLFIRFSSKADYAAYAQISALVFLTTAVQSALINSPALTLLPRLALPERQRLAASFFFLQAVISLVFALALLLILHFWPGIVAAEKLEVSALGFGALIWVAWLRDFVRNQLFIELKAGLCLKLDIQYTVLFFVGIGLVLFGRTLSASLVIGLMALAGAITAVPFLREAGIRMQFDGKAVKECLHKAWALARWSLPGGLIAWAFGNGYVVIAAHAAGPEATADIVAARLFMAPLGMIFLSWSNVFRPRASHWVAEHNWAPLRRATRLSLLAIVVGVFAYIAILAIAYPLLEGWVLGAKYQGLSKDLPWWGAIFLTSGVANIGTGVLLALGRFRETFIASALGSAVSVPLMIVLASTMGKLGVLLALTGGGVLTAGYLLFVVDRHTRRSELI